MKCITIISAIHEKQLYYGYKLINNNYSEYKTAFVNKVKTLIMLLSILVYNYIYYIIYIYLFTRNPLVESFV